MARVTVEDCLEHVDNRFALVMLAVQRVRELRKPGVRPLVRSRNKEAVTALREIAYRHVIFDKDPLQNVRDIKSF